MVLNNRRKTCFLGSSPFTAIPEDQELPGTEGRRDSVESSGSDQRTNWARNDQWVDPVEGEFTLVSTNNYNSFLAELGAGPLSSNMVLRARINLTIKQVRRDTLNLTITLIPRSWTSSGGSAMRRLSGRSPSRGTTRLLGR